MRISASKHGCWVYLEEIGEEDESLLEAVWTAYQEIAFFGLTKAEIEVNPESE